MTIAFAVTEWHATGRYNEPSPIVVPPAAVQGATTSCDARKISHDWVCTRRVGHGGRHAAAIHTGEVFAVWP